MELKTLKLMAAYAAGLVIVGFCVIGIDVLGSTFKTKNAAAPKQYQSVTTEVARIKAAPQSAGKGEADVLVLNSRNTITFRGVVTGEKVAHIQKLLMAKASQLDEDETIYIVLDTPGGSIDAGNQLIDTVKSIPQKVTTVTVFAASMGFQFAQNFGERLIVPSGVLMSHRAAFNGISGQVPGELLVRLQFWMNAVEKLDVIAAGRMKMDVKAYQKLIHDEYWVSGDNAVAAKAADKVVLARCDETLEGTTKEYLGSFMGFEVFGTMSDCPVITGILGVSVKGDGDEHAKQEATAFGWAYRNRAAFFSQYIR